MGLGPEMIERKTIADSKRDFHRSFPYVIPPLYRGVVDELIVELHLLSHQKGFHQNIFFYVGLREVFNTFTVGYRPQEHVNKLFESICKSNGFDASKINNEYKKIIGSINGKSKEELANIMRNEQAGVISKCEYFSRLMSIGIVGLINSLNKPKLSPDELITESLKISDAIGFPQQKVEKDIKLYNSTIEKLSQAIELINESMSKKEKDFEADVKT